MKINGESYRPIEVTDYPVMVVDFVDFTGINFDEPSTYIENGVYKTIGHFPFPLPTAPYRNYRTHRLSNFWIIEGNCGFLKANEEEFNEDEFWLSSAARILAQSKGKENWDDYTGGTEQGMKRHIQEEAAFLRDLAEADYDDLFCVSILPDRNCFACQSTPPEMTGEHCNGISVKDIEDILSIMKTFDENGLQNAYVPFMVSKEGVILGIIISKRNLYLWAGRDDEKSTYEVAKPDTV